MLKFDSEVVILHCFCFVKFLVSKFGFVLSTSWQIYSNCCACLHAVRRIIVCLIAREERTVFWWVRNECCC